MEEVHLWRGSDEQRALRQRVFKSGQFAYFDGQLGRPRWRGRKVLDFGGSAGYLLLNPDCAILEDDYYCLDVVRDAVEEGRARFPRAHFVHYDRYNCSFNPEGAACLRVPDIGVEFDFVLAYSVFTHTGREEMNELVSQLRALLAPGGALAFTFIDPRHRSWPDSPERRDWDNLRWRLEKVRMEENPDVDVDSTAERARAASRQCILVNGSDLYLDTDEIAHYEPEAQRTCYVFHTEEYVKSLFPEATVLPPANDEMQHCCVVRRERE